MKFVAADKPVSTKHPKLGEISVNVEVPQVESMDEFITFCGGGDSALEFINSQIETNAKNGGRAALRNLPENANLDEAKAKIQGIVKEYAPQAGGTREPTAKKKAAVLDSVADLVNSGKEFTREELMALLAQAK